MQQNVLEHRQAHLRVYAVWFSVLYSDSKTGWDPSVISDRRVTNYWVNDHSVGDWFGRAVLKQDGLCWDAFFVYGPGARWRDIPAPLRAYGSPIIRHADDLVHALAPLLR